MSNYVLSAIAKGQARVSAKFQAPELRRKNASVAKLAIENLSISTPNAQELQTSLQRVVDVNYFKKKAQGSATAKVAVHTGTMGDSAVLNVSYAQEVETFSINRKFGANNFLQYDETFANLYEQAWLNLLNRHDDYALAFLHTQRTQLASSVMNPLIASAGTDNGTWNEINHAYEISQADKMLFVQKIKALMASRLYQGPYDVIADLALSNAFEVAVNQGSGNYQNTAFQFDPSWGFVATQSQIDSNYGYGAGYIMPKGTLAGLVWNEKLNKVGFDAGETTTGKLGTISDPFGFGFTADISAYTSRADTSADTTNGSAQDILDQFELTLTVGYVVPPLTLASDSVIHECALVS